MFLVWRIRDVYPGSRIRLFSILDPNCLHSGSRILIKEFKFFNPKKAKKWFLSSKKYDPGCSSRIPGPDADFLPSRIPDPGVKKAPNPGSGSATLHVSEWADFPCCAVEALLVINSWLNTAIHTVVQFEGRNIILKIMLKTLRTCVQVCIPYFLVFQNWNL